MSSVQPACTQPGAGCWVVLGLGTSCLGSLNTHETGGRHEQHMKTNCSFPGKHELISLLPPSPVWPPGQADPPFLSPSSFSPCLRLHFLLALSHISGKDPTPGILSMLFPVALRAMAQGGSYSWAPPRAGRRSVQRAVPSGSPAPGILSVEGLNPHFSAFLAGWSGWRKHRKLPLLPAPLHGALAQRGQVQCHHGGHDQVRWH